MKKKLKVQKAFSGKMMRAATTQGRRVINPGRPGMQQVFGPPRDPNMFSTTPPRPGMSTPFGPKPGVQPGGPPRDPNMFSTTPPRPGMQQPRPDIQFGVQPLPAAPSAAPIPYLQHDLPNNFEPGMKQLLPSPGMQQPAPSGIGGIAHYVLRQKNAPGGLGGQINPGMQQPAPVGLGEYALRQQPAPGGMAQPLPAMKRGGSVIARGNKLARSKPTKMF